MSSGSTVQRDLPCESDADSDADPVGPGLHRRNACATCRAPDRRRGLAGGTLEVEDRGDLWFHLSRHTGTMAHPHAQSSPPIYMRVGGWSGETTVCPLHRRWGCFSGVFRCLIPSTCIRFPILVSDYLFIYFT